MAAKAKSKTKGKTKASKKIISQPKSKLKSSKAKTKPKKPKIKAKTQLKSIKKVQPKLKREKPKKMTTAITSTTSKTPSLGPVGVKPYKVGKDEEYMNSAQLEHFRNILILWKDQLLQDFDRTKQHMQNDAANFPDPSDRATQEEEFSFELRTRDRERKLVKKIEEALDRINNNDYGYCVECGAEIGIRRLEARPTADQCIDCKTFEEIREKQTQG